jgi:peroxiredoxin
MLQPGDAAPSFVAPSTHGEIDLAAMVAQQVTVLYFYPKAGTSG